MSKYYPIMLDVRDRLAIVIGGDCVAANKAAALSASGARVIVISPEFCDELHAVSQDQQITLRCKSYQPGDLAGAFVVVAATTNEPELTEAIYAETQERGQLVNIVDVPARCSFILPSILRRGQLTIAVSTEGASPALAKRIRLQLEAFFPSAYNVYLRLATVVRMHLRKNKNITYTQRDDFFGDFFDSEVLALLAEGKQKEAVVVTAELLQHHGMVSSIASIATIAAELDLDQFS